jgi:exodeoxyribonuclease III
MKLYSWNVNGIRAAQKKGLVEWINREQPDIIGLQETKASPEQLDDELKHIPGYTSYWSSAERKGYSGVALYSRVQPHSVALGLGADEYDTEGRTIVADYGDFVFITAYFPNGSADHSRVPYKMAYKAAFLNYVNNLRNNGRSVIFCGDINTAHREIDLARPKQNRSTTGFLDIERAWIDEVVQAGWLDIYRELNPEKEGCYTWWSQRSGAREKNIGWRIDMFFVSPDLRDRIASVDIHPDVPGSDHCPISLTLHD